MTKISLSPVRNVVKAITPFPRGADASIALGEGRAASPIAGSTDGPRRAPVSVRRLRSEAAALGLIGTASGWLEDFEQSVQHLERLGGGHLVRASLFHQGPNSLQGSRAPQLFEVHDVRPEPVQTEPLRHLDQWLASPSDRYQHVHRGGLLH